MTHELNLNELDAVSGGLQRNPYRDPINQQEAAGISGGSNTVGGSIGGQLVGPPSIGGLEAIGGHPF
jgi:hypothetical protein